MPWARLDDMLPVHPKVRALSDSAFRLYISAICWSNCNQTDGRIPAAQLPYVSDVRRSRYHADQLVQAALWDKTDDGWQIHDYLEYQPSAEKVKRERELKRQRQERWRAHAVDASQDTSVDASSRARTHPIPSRSGSVDPQPSDRNGQRESDLILIQTVQQAMAERTNYAAAVTAEQALRIATQILGNESVRNPAAYIKAAIGRDPNPRRFLPADTPAARPITDALAVAGITPDNKPVRGDTVHGIAAQAREAITKAQATP
jgi:hypothetical protein